MGVEFCCELIYGIRITKDEVKEHVKKFLDDPSELDNCEDKSEEAEKLGFGLEKCSIMSSIGNFIESFEDNTDYFYVGKIYEVELPEVSDLDSIRASLMQDYKSYFTDNVKNEHPEIFQKNNEQFFVAYHPE